jgi:serine/threonine-protein kinase HipA
MNNSFNDITVCPATLQQGFTTYSPKAIKEVFDGVRVSHILPFASPKTEDAGQANFIEKRKRISISGVQEKYSLRLVNGSFELTEKDGTHILKPIPADVMIASQVPANEHVTMQIANQVFKLPVAKCAIIFFSDGEPAYVTKRFDVQENGKRCLKEDFASLAQLSTQNAGADYKYNYSYLKMCELIDAYFPAAIPAKEQFFKQVVFNYLFSNGDAHLKNFSRIDCDGKGDGQLSPAYDLLNTNIHVGDNQLALANGLYDGDHLHPSYSTIGLYAYDDFITFGEKMGLLTARVQRMVNGFLDKTDLVTSMVQRSFLNPAIKATYVQEYKNRLSLLGNIINEKIK